MGTMTVLKSTYPRFTAGVRRPVAWLSRIGDHMLFYLRALGGIPHAFVHFRKEVIRLIAEISMGAGTLAMIGGTVVIVGFLTLAAGGTLAVQGYSLAGQHRHRGVDRVPGGVHQRAHRRTGGGRYRAGSDLRRGGDRAVGGDAHQRGDRRAGVDGDPSDRVSGQSTRIIAGMIAITPLYSIAVILSFVRQPVHDGGAVRPVRRPV